MSRSEMDWQASEPKARARLFVTALQSAWAELSHEPSAVLSAYKGSTSWSEFVLGPKALLDLSQEQKNLFPLIAYKLKHEHGVDVREVRQGNEYIDMSLLVGAQCLGTERGWGYASRQFVLIEHENEIYRSEDEFYKLLFRVADLKVIAMPASIGKISSEASKMLAKFREIRDLVDVGEQAKNILVLFAGRDKSHVLPEWSCAWSDDPHFGNDGCLAKSEAFVSSLT